MGEPADDDEARTNAAGNADPKAATRVEVPERQSKPKLENAPDFGLRYRVLGMLGKGGMGEVYRAFDNELNSEVALKIVRDEGGAAFQRFLREISLARKVTSTNVLRVYDLSEHAGLKFLTMELVSGEDLSALLKREPRLPRARALDIFRQVCSGLAAAHKQGVVHRDLKPANVLLDDEGNVRVADFGLARSIGDSGMTASGAVLGSPAYMSPEQVKGDPADERSDIYSLGIMLYQLLCGETPFQGDSPHTVMSMRLHKKPRPLRELVPDLPAHLEAVTAKCLALEPAERYRTIGELTAELDGATPTAAATQTMPRSPRRLGLVVGAVAVVGVGVVVAVVLSGRTKTEAPPLAPAVTAPAATTPPTTTTKRKRIPVLITDLDNRTKESLFDGAVEQALSNGLKYSMGLDPRAKGGLRMLLGQLYPDTAISLEEAARGIAKKDGIKTAVLRPSVLTRGAGYVLQIEIMDGETGKQLLKTSEEIATLKDAMPAIGRLAWATRGALGEKVPATPPPADLGLSTNFEAVNEYASAYEFVRANNTAIAIPKLQHVIEMDPGFAAAYVSLGLTYFNAGRRAKSRETYTEALKYKERLSDRERLKFLGEYYMHTTHEYDRAITVFRELLDMWPDSFVENNLAIAYVMRHEVVKALEVDRRLAAEDAGDVSVWCNVANLELMVSNFDGAIEAANQVLTKFPKPLPTIYLYIGLSREMRGETKLADEHIAKFEKLDAFRGFIARADLLVTRGRLDDATTLLTEALKGTAKDKPDEIELDYRLLAETRIAAGDKAGALAAANHPTKDSSNTFAVAMVQLAAGDDAAATATAKRLLEDSSGDARAYAKLIEAQRASNRRQFDQALARVDEAALLSNIWDVDVVRGRIALEAGKHAVALAALQAAFARRGEGAVTTDDLATLRYVPPLHYYLGRTHEALGSRVEAAKSYKAFLAMRPDAQHDAMVDDARKRLAAVGG